MNTLPSCLDLLAALLAADGRLSRQTELCDLKIFSKFALSAIIGLWANVTQPLVLVGKTLLWDTISVRTIQWIKTRAGFCRHHQLNKHMTLRSHPSEICSRRSPAVCLDPALREHGFYIYQLLEREKHIRNVHMPVNGWLGQDIIWFLPSLAKMTETSWTTSPVAREDDSQTASSRDTYCFMEGLCSTLRDWNDNKGS